MRNPAEAGDDFSETGPLDHTQYPIGIWENRAQFGHQLLQVVFVGLTIGMMRTVVPALAAEEFGVAEGSFLALTSFVVAFGLVKSGLNFVAGRLSERKGRKHVLVAGWVSALPIPLLLYWAQNWGWVVAATVLLGINQGLTWSMTQTAKLDLAKAQQRGLAIGLNEFGGYSGVALGGIVTGYAAGGLGPRVGLALFGGVVVAGALLSAVLFVRDTLPWALAEVSRSGRERPPSQDAASGGEHAGATLGTWDVFAMTSWRDLRFLAINQAGLVEKFVDALVWIALPVFLYDRGVDLPTIGWVAGLYGFAWAGGQLFTGPLSDRVGRRWPNVLGMWVCGGGVIHLALAGDVIGWSLAAVTTGLGMALLYPNLSAAVADLAHPAWRGSAIGIYRFWRDLGYAVGALFLGVLVQYGGGVTAAFWGVAGSMFLSGALLMVLCGETHPGKVGSRSSAR